MWCVWSGVYVSGVLAWKAGWLVEQFGIDGIGGDGVLVLRGGLG